MALQEFNLPDPGEGLTEAEIVAWKVAPGDTVKVNDVVVEIETAKSLVELPVPFAGTVNGAARRRGRHRRRRHADHRRRRRPGRRRGPRLRPLPRRASRPRRPPRPGAEASRRRRGEGQVLSAARPRPDASRPRRLRRQADRGHRRPRKGCTQPREVRRLRAPCRVDARRRRVEPPRPLPVPAPCRRRPLAKPPVRKLAKDLGIDLRRHARPARTASSPAPTSRPRVGPATAAPPRRRRRPRPPRPHGPVRPGRARDAHPVKGVRKMTAQAMVGSAFTAPHVTEWVTVDVTATMELVDRLKRDRSSATSRSRRCSSSPRRCASPSGATPASTRRGTRPPRRSSSSTTSTSASPRPPRAGSSSRTSRTPTGCRCASSPRRSAPSPRPPARVAPSRPTCPAARSPSPTSASSASTPAPRSSTRGRRPSSPSARHPAAVGRHRRRRQRRSSRRWVTTLALSFDHRLVDGELGSRYLADVAAILADPRAGLVWG